MAVSDTVISNLTTIYLAVIAGIKAYAMVFGRNCGFGFVLIVSTTLVGIILIGTLTWDVSRKATYALSKDHNINVNEICKGGICWHGVAVKSPASQLRFSLPHNELLLRHRRHQYGLGKILIKEMPQPSLISDTSNLFYNQQVLKTDFQPQQNSDHEEDNCSSADYLLMHFTG